MEIARLRFLVVEDQGFQRWLVGNLLQDLGAKAVLSAGDGVAALEILKSADPPIDVVVSDLDMPGMDGMELIRHMAQLNLSARLVLVSSLEGRLIATVETMARAYGVNLLGAIQKPLTANKLRGLIASHLVSAQQPNVAETVFTAEEIAQGVHAHQFEVYFQPKVEIKSREIRGAEALVRWRHPDKGLILPKAFLETVEETGLIDELTREIVTDAARNCREWRSGGIDMTVSVNLSILSLSDATLADRMTALVKDAGLECRHVTFEITESAAARELGTKLENLSRLRMKGFGLSIDDYGTGYSSLQRLSRVPFTELKIDQSFVKNASTLASNRALVESSLELAQKLGITAVAEGVDSHADWELLLALGCPLAQGYLIARPMQAGEFTEWVTARRRDTA
jgi:EAL domain-containing protein (putative c-di-GMP-specific phosphodiesterase class I)/AmiR/NasT family two-component response regulator